MTRKSLATLILLAVLLAGCGGGGGGTSGGSGTPAASNNTAPPAPPTAPAAPPTANKVTPNTGTVSGGTSVTVDGSGYDATTTLMIGGKSAPITSRTGNKLIATTAANSAGAADVKVANGDGQSATMTGGFTYTALPVKGTITSIDDPIAEDGGSAHIFRVHYVGDQPTSVPVNSVNATFTNISAGVIDVTVPSGTRQNDIVLTNGGGSSVASSVAMLPPPTLTTPSGVTNFKTGVTGLNTVVYSDPTPGNPTSGDERLFATCIGAPSTIIRYLLDGTLEQTMNVDLPAYGAVDSNGDLLVAQFPTVRAFSKVPRSGNTVGGPFSVNFDYNGNAVTRDAYGLLLDALGLAWVSGTNRSDLQQFNAGGSVTTKVIPLGFTQGGPTFFIPEANVAVVTRASDQSFWRMKLDDANPTPVRIGSATGNSVVDMNYVRGRNEFLIVNGIPNGSVQAIRLTDGTSPWIWPVTGGETPSGITTGNGRAFRARTGNVIEVGTL